MCGPERHEYERCLYAVYEQDRDKYVEKATQRKVNKARAARGMEPLEQ